MRAREIFLSLKFCALILGFYAGLSACGGILSPSPDGITAHVLVLVTDAGGNPVPGATVWVPADPEPQALTLAGEEWGLALVDEQGNTCADPPAAALFAACTDAEGLALLPCGDDGVFLLNYFKDAASGTTSAKCAEGGVVPAPFDP